MGIQVVGHTSFLGHTGYNNHSRNFFTSLNKLIPVRVRNYTYVEDLSYLSEDQKHMLIEQEWDHPPFKVGDPFHASQNDTQVNLVLNESHHYYFYENYNRPMIAYNVWESTRQLDEFFKRCLDYDQFWCPTEWQRQCTIDQGYPEDRVKVVPEAVNGNIFKPYNSEDERNNELLSLYKKYNIPDNAFCFMIFGRWDYRKSTGEMIEAFLHEFKEDNIYLVVSLDNPFSTDDLQTTEDRLKHFGLENERIKVLHFPEREEYVKWIRSGHVLLSCSRAEGWNLPLIEAIASGTPSVYSDWGAHKEFADGIGYPVQIADYKPPSNIYNLEGDYDLGVWSEPNYDHLKSVMRRLYKNYVYERPQAEKLSRFVRQTYTWDNAAQIAESHIKELVEKKYSIVEADISEKVRINLGCGNDIRAGYINIDRYNNTGNVDLSADLTALPFKKESLDEIYLGHVFEHISINDIYEIVNGWKMLLKPNGKLVIRVPNLEHEVRTWLESGDEEKWSSIHNIFGSQSHPGNSHLCGFNAGSLKSFLERFNFDVETLEERNNGFGEEIKIVVRKKSNEKEFQANYRFHFVDGPFIDIRGDDQDNSYYQVDFLDPDNESSVHQTTLEVNHWTRPFRKYYTNWLVQARKNGVLEFEHNFDLTGHDVMISLNSKSMGDTIAWFPYIEEFRKKHNCNVHISTFWNSLFEGSKKYSKLNFISPGTTIDMLYASYTVGCFDNDSNKNKVNWRTVPLQKVACDFLGLDYKEIIPEIGVEILERPKIGKYVTLSEHSTFQCKYWNFPGGWQTVVDYLKDVGYEVMVISKEETKLKNIVNATNKSINETISNIYHSEFFMGVSAGPSWLAWALKKPVILISGYSSKDAEFFTNVKRIINEDVCHACFNDTESEMDRGDWDWCPRHRNTNREHECSKKIEPLRVVEAIDSLRRSNS